MTDTEYNAAAAKKRLTFLDYLADSLPKGTKLGLLINGILSIVIVVGLILVFSKQLASETIRDQSIKERRQMAAELHALKLEVDSALSNNNRNTHTLDEVLLKLTQAELRGLQNKSSMDTIKSILFHNQLK